MRVSTSRADRSESPGVAHTQSQLRDAGQLREEMRKHLRKSASDSKIRLGGASHANKVKQRALHIQELTKELKTLLAGIGSTRITLRRCISDLKQQGGAVKAFLSVCNKRIELRSQRPATELFQDSFDEALSQEQSVYLTVQESLNTQAQAGQEFTKPLETAAKELQAARLTLHSDSSGCAEKLVIEASEVFHSAEQYCKDSTTLLEEVQGLMQHVREQSCAMMKKQITQTYDLRLQIESDMSITTSTISDAELHLAKIEKQLRISLEMPEREIDCGGEGRNDKLSAKTGVLATLRAKIKSAAYTGPGGRNLDVIFGRFDRDRSGELDDEEVRVAIRTGCKIPPDVITDVDIVALCELLDSDSSGSISIAELVDFLLADVDVQDLRDQIAMKTDTLDRLKAAQAQTLLDFRSKSMTWRINEACAKVTPVKGLALDGSASKERPRKRSSGLGARMPAQWRARTIAAKARAIATEKVKLLRSEGSFSSSVGSAPFLEAASSLPPGAGLKRIVSELEESEEPMPPLVFGVWGLPEPPDALGVNLPLLSETPTAPEALGTNVLALSETLAAPEALRIKMMPIVAELRSQVSMCRNSPAPSSRQSSSRAGSAPAKVRKASELFQTAGTRNEFVNARKASVGTRSVRREYFVDMLMDEDERLRKSLQHAFHAGSDDSAASALRRHASITPQVASVYFSPRGEKWG